jgi:hypothetical protein
VALLGISSTQNLIVETDAQSMPWTCCCSAGAINSNPDNDPDFDICYSAEVPADCLDSGGLRNDAVEVKLAVAALAGTVRRVGLTRTNHDMQEVKVDEPGQFVASTVIKLSQPVDVQKGPTQCKVHTAAAAKGPNSA